MVDLTDKQGAFAKEENLTIRALECSKLDKIKQEMGTKPEALSCEYNPPPTLWGSIRALAQDWIPQHQI
jgi:hypothetical protein